MNSNRSLFVVALLGLILSVGLVACGDSDAVNAQNEEKASDGEIAIRVDDQTMTKSELDERIKMRMQPLMQRFGAESMDDLPPKLQMMKSRFKRRIVNQAETQLLLISHAKQAGITVSQEEVDEKWNSLKERFPSEQQFQQQLDKMGKTKEDFIEDIRRSILIEKFSEQRLGDISVTEQELRDYFEENKEQYGQKERIHARHILVESDSQAESDIRDIKSEIDEGASFEEMAREHSEGPSAQRGGDLETFPRGKMVPAFDEVAFNLEPGVVSDPVETRFGYHLIKVEEKMDSKPADFESNREEIEQTVKQQKQQAKMKQLVQRLREESEIENNVEISSPQGMRRMPGGAGGGQSPGAGQTPGGQSGQSR